MSTQYADLFPEEQSSAQQAAPGRPGLLRLERRRRTRFQGDSTCWSKQDRHQADSLSTSFQFIKDREVEVEPGFTLSQQIGIATAALTDEGDRNLVDLVLKVSCSVSEHNPDRAHSVYHFVQNLVIASAARADIVQATDGHASTAPAEEPVEDDEDPDSEEALRKKAAALSAGPSEKARELFVPHVVEWPGDEERKAATVNAHFKLLMRLLKWEHAKGE